MTTEKEELLRLLGEALPFVEDALIDARCRVNGDARVKAYEKLCSDIGKALADSSKEEANG